MTNLQTTAKTAGGFDNRTGKKSPTIKVNREEAAWVNRQAADVYRALGNEGEAQKREMMMRFYQADDADRNGNQFFISRHKGNAMSAITPEKQELREMQAKDSSVVKKDLSEDPQKRELSKQILIERNGKNNLIKIVPALQFQVEGSLKPLSSEQITETYIYKDKKGKVAPKGYEYKYRNQVRTKQIVEPQELNRAGTGRAIRAAGVAALPEEFNKWFPILTDLYLGTSKSRTSKREGLKDAVFQQENLPVPPKPEKLPQLRWRLRESFGKETANQMMKFVEEASYAYWNYQTK